MGPPYNQKIEVFTIIIYLLINGKLILFLGMILIVKFRFHSFKTTKKIWVKKI